MQKRLIIALAICVLILSACGMVQGTTSATSSSVSHSAVNTQTACSAFQEQQAQLQQAIDAASVQLSSAHGDASSLHPSPGRRAAHAVSPA